MLFLAEKKGREEKIKKQGWKEKSMKGCFSQAVRKIPGVTCMLACLTGDLGMSVG